MLSCFLKEVFKIILYIFSHCFRSAISPLIPNFIVVNGVNSESFLEFLIWVPMSPTQLKSVDCVFMVSSTHLDPTIFHLPLFYKVP